MTNVSTWFYPLRKTPEDAEAASRAVDFMLGWFVVPVITGDYPPSMRENVGERLPIFKPDDVKLVRGMDEVNDKTLTISKLLLMKQGLSITGTISHFFKKAMEHGVRVKGYFIWSFLDNFEWTQGYNVRFGIFYVDFENGCLTRFPKRSAVWWMNFLNKPKIPWNKLPWKLQDVKTEEEHGPVKRPRCDDAEN